MLGVNNNPLEVCQAPLGKGVREGRNAVVADLVVGEPERGQA